MADTAPARRKAPLWLETIILLVIAIALALVIKTFFVQAFYIPSSSMEPGLVINDRILVQKPSYWFGEPQRGDVVVFEDPGQWLPGPDPGPTNPVTRAMAAIGLYPTGGHLVKRVIGVAGDTIVCCDDQGRLEINGKAIDENQFLAPRRKCDGPMPSQCKEKWSVGPIPEGDLFVMGDNRAHSADSSEKLCGESEGNCDPNDAYVSVDLVVGKVFSLVWPIDHFDWVGRPDAFDDVPDPS
ncbi:MAG: signal peptidase I [Actinomycetota bacterium]|nr:signal peptidase I [Actinomycetota bacterium]